MLTQGPRAPTIGTHTRKGVHIPANPHAKAAARAAAEAILDKKGDDVALLDVSDLLVVTDVFVIGTGTSSRHVRSLADDVEQHLSELGDRPLRKEGADYGRWVLVDYGDFVVHLFDAETRDFYDLERLWADAPRVEFSVPAATSDV